MKKKFVLDGLDCANCAARMEEAIKKIEGVEEASVSFLTSKLIIEADEADMDRIVEQASAAIAKVHNGTRIVI